MSFINYTAREVNCKVVYYGAGLSGKTTNIQYIYEKTHTDQKNQLITLSAENERTLFFDFLPLGIGDFRGFKTRFHLYSIPGQTFFDLSKDFILKGIDGAVFVVDSHPERIEANIENFNSFQKSLERQGYELDQLPLVFQYNKRDASNALSIEELQATFNATKKPYFEAVAHQGVGVMETLQTISQWVIREIKGGNA